MLPDFESELEQQIAHLERQELDTEQPQWVDLQDLLNGLEFVRITRLANLEDSETLGNMLSYLSNMTISAHGYEDYLTVVLTGDSQQVSLYLSVKNAKTTQNLLSAFPGIGLAAHPITNLGTVLLPRVKHAGMLSGIPALDISQSDQESHELRFERIIRAMRNETWAYIVSAYPRPKEWSVKERKRALDKAASFASIVRQQVQKSRQSSSVQTKHETEVVSEMIGGETVNRRAEYALKLIERQIKRLETAFSLGLWQTAVYFGAADKDATRKLACLLKGVLSAPDSYPDPIRTYPLSPGSKNDSSLFHTNLNSQELSLFIGFPQEEAPGISIIERTVYDVDFEDTPDKNLAVGKILWDECDTGKMYRINTEDLSRHGVVFGVTGSGKTTTLMSILTQLAQPPTSVPFLVIEPAKTEYRSLLGKIQNKTAAGPLPDLRIYTLGNDSVAPFRLNPFEFETGDTPGDTPILSHIDFLKAVFNAAFILYAPMPYVLEMALYEVYEDKGWNMAGGVNVRLPDSDWKNRHLYPIFPTLTDLYHKVETVTARLGYESKIEQDVVAGLKARIGALRLGAKGLMLDTPRGVPMSRLLAKPTVLELESIGGDDEKTFIMGLLLTRIYSYRRQQAMEGNLTGQLQHVLVVEEAHRLLKNVSTTVEVESSNLRAQAIETFVNMLSEVRHYGQGVLVAEQIPTKLTPDVIKNTNLKLVHRMLAQDDREVVSSTMNMTEDQVRNLSILGRGKAVAFAEGDDHPFLLQIENFKQKYKLFQPSDSDLKSFTSSRILLGQFLPVTDFSHYGLAATNYGAPDPMLYQFIQRYLSQADVRPLWARLFARTLFARQSLLDGMNQIRQQYLIHSGQTVSNLSNDTFLALLIFGISQMLQERAMERGWLYATVDEMRILLTTLLISSSQKKSLAGLEKPLDSFQSLYQKYAQREVGYFPGCDQCPSVCYYHIEISRLVSRIDIGRVQSILKSSAYQDEKEKYKDLGDTLIRIIRQWLGNPAGEEKSLAYCAGLVCAQKLHLDEYEQAMFADRLSKV